MKVVRGKSGIVGIAGIEGGGSHVGLKSKGARDMAVVKFPAAFSAAGVYTRNLAIAAPVSLTRERVRKHGVAGSLVINTVYANAITGPQGAADAEEMATIVETYFGGPGLVLSTGVIGHNLPMDIIRAGIAQVEIGASEAHGQYLAEAIMTTDTRPKTANITVDMTDADGKASGQRLSVGGSAKGSGMIHPNMATMLGVIALDMAVDAESLNKMLSYAVDHSFHQISVDGDTSTNDTVLLFSPPATSGDVLTVNDPRYPQVREAVRAVANDLAEQIIEDAEGITRIMELHVEGARNVSEAKAIANNVCCSALVKTALAGGDPNWGRIVSAACTAGVAVDPNQLNVLVGDTLVYQDGQPTQADRADLRKIFSADRVRVTLDFKLGQAKTRMLTTDFSHGYVEINSEYYS